MSAIGGFIKRVGGSIKDVGEHEVKQFKEDVSDIRRTFGQVKEDFSRRGSTLNHAIHPEAIRRGVRHHHPLSNRRQTDPNRHGRTLPVARIVRKSPPETIADRSFHSTDRFFDQFDPQDPEEEFLTPLPRT